MLIGFLNGFHIENPMKLTNHPFNILGLKVTVFHRLNNVTTAGIVAPPLGHHHIQSQIFFHFDSPYSIIGGAQGRDVLGCHQTEYPARRS